MTFLDPKIDIVFKKLFGDMSHKNIVISFLNSVLNRQPKEQIVDVTINLPETLASKTSIVDIRCTDQADNQYIIEMQVLTQKDYAARAQYYSALALSRQLAKKETYSNLVPVIFVGILDFNLFKNQHYISCHTILDTEIYVCELKHLEFYFIELPKFHKHIENVTSILDKWIFFLKHAMTLHSIPNNMQEPAFKDAFYVLAQTNWSRAELEAYDRYLDSIRSAASQLETAIEHGRAEGKVEGKEENQITVIRNMLGHFSIADISRATGLSPEDIKKLKDKI